MPVAVGEGNARKKKDGGDGVLAGEFVGSHKAPPGGELVDPFGWDRVGLDEFFDSLGCFVRILVVVECDEVGSGGVFGRTPLAGGRIDARCGDGGRRAAMVSHPLWWVIYCILWSGVDVLCSWNVLMHSLAKAESLWP